MPSRAILAGCRSGEDPCPAAAREFLNIIEAGRERQGRARLGEINRAINLRVKPVSDIQQYGLDDYWASPLEMLTSHAGDCEDYAIAKYVALQAAGVAPDDLRLVIVRDLRHQATHAVLAVYQDGEWLLLDNRTLVMVSANEVRGYLPLYVLDQGGVRAVASAPTQAPMGTLSRAITVRIARNDHENGAPGEIRTPDPQIRSLMLQAPALPLSGRS